MFKNIKKKRSKRRILSNLSELRDYVQLYDIVADKNEVDEIIKEIDKTKNRVSSLK